MAIPSLIPTAINLKLESAGPLLVVEQLISSFGISLRYSDSNLNGYKSLLVTLGSAECRSLELPLVFLQSRQSSTGVQASHWQVQVDTGSL